MNANCRGFMFKDSGDEFHFSAGVLGTCSSVQDLERDLPLPGKEGGSEVRSMRLSNHQSA